MRILLALTLIFFGDRLLTRAASIGSEFSFEYREGLIWVEVQADGHEEPLQFLLDSGAQVSVISLRAAKRLGLPRAPEVRVRGVHASQIGYWPQKLSATANGVSLPNEFLALDLSSLGRACQRPVDGLIGADFFRDRAIQIDFSESKVRLLSTVKDGSIIRTLPMKLRSGGMNVKVGVNGDKPRWMRLDTGCASPLQWVAGRGAKESGRGKVLTGLTDLEISQRLSTVMLGRMTFYDVPTGVHEVAIFPGEAGLLGNGILARFSTVTIDAKAGRLVLAL